MVCCTIRSQAIIKTNTGRSPMNYHPNDVQTNSIQILFNGKSSGPTCIHIYTTKHCKCFQDSHIQNRYQIKTWRKIILKKEFYDCFGFLYLDVTETMWYPLDIIHCLVLTPANSGHTSQHHGSRFLHDIGEIDPSQTTRENRVHEFWYVLLFSFSNLDTFGMN